MNNWVRTLATGTWIAEKRRTVWYSAPSIVSLLARFVKLDQQNILRLDSCLFAGEVFPIQIPKH